MEDPSTRKILKGGKTQINFQLGYMQKFRSLWLPSREEIKDGGHQPQTCKLSPSALFACASNYVSAELSQSLGGGNTHQNCRPLLRDAH